MISREYKLLLRDKHKNKPWGGAGASWVPWILPILNKLPPGKLTALDFGCGRGTLKPELERMNPDCTVLEYDPGVLGKDLLPKQPVDLVVCTDVMEHVEEQFVDQTLKFIDWLSVHAAFFNIDLAESKSFLPDGRNTHITIKPAEWWLERLAINLPGMDWTVNEEKKSRIVVTGTRGIYYGE